jgi:septation ring formation regulator EzrA
VRAVPRLSEFYPGICLTTEQKARENLSQVKKNLSQAKKNLSQSTVYILPKHPHITKPTQTHTLQNPQKHTHTHTLQNPHKHTHTQTHTLQNNINPPRYKLKQTQCKTYPNEIVTI